MNPQPGEQIEVKLVLDGPAPQPVTFTIDNPARISVDLPGTTLALPSRRIDVKSGGVDTILAAEASGRSRLVFNLDRCGPTRRGSTATPCRHDRAGQQFAAQAAPAAVTAGGTARATARNVRAIDRKGGFPPRRRRCRAHPRHAQRSAGAGQPEAGRRPHRDRLPGTALPDAYARRFDVVDFATPVSTFDVTRGPNGARIVVAAAGDFEQLAYQSDRDYVLEVRPRPKVAAVDPSKREYKGERLTLNFQDIETRAVLQLLAETSGQNIVVSDTVQGNVTLRLQNVPWDQAMDIVLRTKGLDKRQEGNVIIVAPPRNCRPARSRCSSRRRRSSSSRRSVPSTCR